MLLARGLAQPDGAWLLPLDTRNPTENSSENETIRMGGQFHGYRRRFATSSTSITTPSSLRFQYRTRHFSASSSSSPLWPPVRSRCYYRNGEPELRECHRKFFRSVHQQPCGPRLNHTQLQQLRSQR